MFSFSFLHSKQVKILLTYQTTWIRARHLLNRRLIRIQVVCIIYCDGEEQAKNYLSYTNSISDAFIERQEYFNPYHAEGDRDVKCKQLGSR